MKITTKKLLILVAVVAVMTAALVTAASADVSWDAAKATFPGGSNSAYADVNSAGWVQVASPSGLDNGGDGVYTNEGDLSKGNDYKAYFNESTGTLMIEMTKDYAFTGNSGDTANVKTFAYWCAGGCSCVRNQRIVVCCNCYFYHG